MDNMLFNLLDADRQRAVGNVREAAGRIWARPLHRYYTDHTVAHSERVIALLDGLTAGMMATEKRLAADEAFVLLAAAYLHDIGMQDERAGDRSSLGQSLEAIRVHHHEISAELIYRAAEDPAQALSLGLPHDPGLVEAVALVAKGHRQVDLGAAEYEPLVHGGETVRLRLLAALLRLGDELDIDHRRVDLEMLKLWNLPLESQLHWWKCHYVSGVSIVDEYVRVAYRFPQDRPDYEGLIVPLVEGDVRRKLDELEEVLRANAVKAALGKPQVRAMRLVLPLPPDVERLAREGGGRGGDLPRPKKRKKPAAAPPVAPDQAATVFDMRGQTVGAQVNVAGDYVDRRGAPPQAGLADEIASLERQVDKLRRNLLAIREKRAEFIDPRSAPPDLEEAERLTRLEIAQIEARLARLRAR